MESIGKIIRKLREEKGEPLRKLAAYLDIDQAVMSKIETGRRRATKQHIEKLAKYFQVDKKNMLIAWLSDRIIYEIKDEELGEEALKAAEEQIAYLKYQKTTKSSIINKINRFFREDGRINRAWIFGSFSRGDDNQLSDIDLLVEEIPNEKFNYFDLADIQYKLELLINRKFDIGFASSLHPNIAENIEDEKRLIYEKRKGKK